MWQPWLELSVLPLVQGPLEHTPPTQRTLMFWLLQEHTLETGSGGNRFHLSVMTYRLALCPMSYCFIGSRMCIQIKQKNQWIHLKSLIFCTVFNLRIILAEALLIFMLCYFEFWFLCRWILWDLFGNSGWNSCYIQKKPLNVHKNSFYIFYINLIHLCLECLCGTIT